MLSRDINGWVVLQVHEISHQMEIHWRRAKTCFCQETLRVIILSTDVKCEMKEEGPICVSPVSHLVGFD